MYIEEQQPLLAAKRMAGNAPLNTVVVNGKPFPEQKGGKGVARSGNHGSFHRRQNIDAAFGIWIGVQRPHHIGGAVFFLV